jgi:hydrogenase-1 operon protein HyaF
MKPFPMPVRVSGPGSQDVDDAPGYLPMPHEMSVFRMPVVPDTADTQALAAARDVLADFVRSLESWNVERDPYGPTLDVGRLPPAVVEIVNQMLGEGEVSIVITGSRGARVQESVFTGIWRVCEFDAAGDLTADRLEAAALPSIAVDTARASAAETIVDAAAPQGAMNAPALLREIAAQMRTRRPQGAAHIVNLTLFPLTPEDHALLERALPVGPVAMIARGFGNCRVTSTLARDVWRVQYFNNMNTLILNTIEVVGVPEVALAAHEDLDDSRSRLAELVDWMSESCDA